MKRNLCLLFLSQFIFLVAITRSHATHVIGATINYVYQGGDKYKVSILLYRDCRKGTVQAPDSIALTIRRSDNKSFIHIFKKIAKINLPLPLPDPCAEPPAVQVCVEQYEYSKIIDGIEAGFEHHLFFSTRARNTTITNINNPGGQAETVYTKIPDRNLTPNIANAQFVSAPPSYVCGGRAFTVKDSAYDADGDKITFQFYNIKGGNYSKIPGNDQELRDYLPGIYIPTLTNGYPNFVDIPYVNPYKTNSPMNANETLDTTTGNLVINANAYGQFVVGIKLKEYRGNQLISETFRDYQFNVVNCPPPSKSVLALTDVCNSLTIQPTNSGAYYPSTKFKWKFNDPVKAPKDTSSKQTPSFTYSKPGNYKVKLVVNPNNACRDSSEFTIKVSDIKSIFKVTSDTCVKVPIAFTNNSTASANAPITGYKWTFGDNTSSTATSPTHSYTIGGSYHIKLIVTNSIGCVDSSAGIIKVIQDYPDALAGLQDTICRNNPTAQLNATVKNAGGGIWSGGAGLFDPSTSDLQAKYTPTAAELAQNSIKLLLTTTQNGKCGFDTSSVILRFYSPPSVTPALSPYSSICANNPIVTLRGGISIPTYGISWKAGGGKFSDSTFVFSTYVPTAAELAAGKVDLTITSTKNGKCLPISASTSIPVKPAPTIFAGNDTTVCANNANVSLKGKVTLVSKVLWASTGDGTFVSTSALSTTYRPGTNDKTNGLVRIILKTNETLTSVYPQNCQAVSDTMFITITPAPVVDAGSAISECENKPMASLTGSVKIGNAKWTGTWSGGKGSFNPVKDSLKISYMPSDSEVIAKSVKLLLTSTNNGKCLAVKDSVLITYTPKPVVDAGIAQSLCKNNSLALLDGNVSGGASTGKWTGGKGTFTTNTKLNATYQPTASELATGSLKLTLTSTGNGKCLADSNTIVLTFLDQPQIDAGIAVLACKNNPNVKLNATLIRVAKGIKWTGGAGTFVPNDTTLNAQYQPTSTEINSGKLILTATATGIGNCNPVSDTLSITFIDKPTINPGTAGPVCANNPDIKLSGSTSTTKGIWSSATGGQFLPNASTLNATYVPSKTDSTSGSVVLKLTSDNNGLCVAETSTVTATITQAPKVNAGAQQNICSNNAFIKLAGSVSGGASTGIWTGGTNNFSGSNTNLTTTYVPSASEIATGRVTLTLTSTNNGTCNAVSDTATYYFTPAPVITTGGDQTVCGDVASVSINGTSTTNSGIWKTSGTGTFGDSTKLSTTYAPSQVDVDNNSVILTLRSANNGNCNGVSKTLTLSFSTKPVANAGNDITFCTADSMVQLAATGSPGKWTTTSGGQFTPAATNQNAKYKPSTADLASNNFTLTYTTNASGSCNAVKDDVKISVVKSPVANPGTSKTICSDETVSLSGAVQNASAMQWVSSGNGTFATSDTIAKPTYKPSANDKTNRTVTLTLKALSSQCPATSKSIVITINPQYSVNAGGNRTICSDVTEISLAGSRSASFPVKWTSSTGDGIFIPSDTVPGAKYIPTAAALSATSFKLTLASKGTGCPNKSSTITVSVTKAPKVEAGNDLVICNDTANVKLVGTLLNTTATGGFWTTNAGGTLNPNSLNATYTPKVGEKGAFKFYLNSTGGICNAVKDSLTMTINDKPTLSVGSDAKVCADADTIYLNATLSNATGGLWTVRIGTGVLGNANNTKAFYRPSASDKTNGLVTFGFMTSKSTDGCKPISRQVSFEITPAPTVFAGGDLTYCANATQIPLTATIQKVDSVMWYTLGSGTFSTPKALSTNYLFSSGDTTNKKVSVVVKSFPTALCKAKLDTLLITIIPQPQVTIPADFSVCADTSFITLSAASSTGAGLWSSDAGNTFSPSAGNVNVKYLPSPSDLKKANIKFTFTSGNNTPCSAVSKSVIVTILPAPKINAGVDQIICSDASTITLSATPSTGVGVQWTSSGSGTFGSSFTKVGSVASDSYLVTSLDTAAKTVVFTAKTTGNGLCRAVEDQVIVKMTPHPIVDAGPASATICGDIKAYSLQGKVRNARYFKWSTSGSGKFAANDSTLAPNYLISSADSLSGSVKLKMTGIGQGVCKTYTDSLVLRITPAPKVFVGEDRTICADKDTINVRGTKTVASGVIWTASGKGTFAPLATSLTPTYQIAADDKKVGTVVLRMAGTGIGTCKPVSDSLVLTINPSPIVNAGTDEAYCASVQDIGLNGSVKVASQVVWTTSGTGTFDDSSYVSTVYSPSAADKAAKAVTLTLSTVDHGLCKAVNSKVVFSFTPLPEADAGNDQVVCKDASKVILSGKLKNATIGQWEAVDGSGTFSTEPTTPSLSYNISSLDTTNTSLTFSYTTLNNGVCPAGTKTMKVTFLPTPKVNAGVDQFVCSDAQQISLSGVVENGSGGTWISSGINAVVASGTNLNATYALTPADISTGSVKFTLTSKNNNGCKAYSDEAVVFIQKAPVVVSIPSHSICADTSGVQLVPDTSNVGSFVWSTLAGTSSFGPSNTVFSPLFVPTASQVADGSAVINLTVKGKGACSATSAQASTTISISDKPKFTISDVSVCQGGDTVTLNASNDNGVATAYIWSTLSATGTFSNNQALTTEYVTSASERTLVNASVDLLFKTTAQGKCKAFSQVVKVNFTPTSSVNAGSDLTTCTNQDSVRLNASGSSSGVWTRILTSGVGGSFKPSASSPDASYFFSTDDEAAHIVLLEFKSKLKGSCVEKRDTMALTINQGPTFNLGGDQTICANIGSVTLDANNSLGSKVVWLSNGTGTFADSTVSPTHYAFSDNDIASGSLIMKARVKDIADLCKAEMKQIKVLITPAPVVNAGSDLSVCANAISVPVRGSITKSASTAGAWSVISTSPGTFVSSNSASSTSLSDTYQPSANDTTSKTVSFILTANDNGKCNPVSDTAVVLFTPSPIIKAGGNLQVCGDTAFAPVSANVSIVGGGSWSSNGQGTLLNSGVLSTGYVPSDEERDNGATVKLVVTSNALGTCLSVKDSVILTIGARPLLDKGLDVIACGDTSFIELGGTVSNVAGGIWTISQGFGRFQSTQGNSTTLLNDRYLPSSLDLNNGTVTLLLTTTGTSGQCKPVSNLKFIRLTPVPVLEAGSDILVCANNKNVNLSGVLGNKIASGGAWITTGSGHFVPKSDTLVNTYVPSVQDSLSGNVTLFLVSTGNGNCKAARDTVTFNITPTPIVTVSSDMDICADSSAVAIKGTFTEAGSAKWSTSGTGSFANAGTNTTQYFPKGESGKIFLTFTTEGGYCNPVSKKITLDISPKPVINAGSDTTVCADAFSFGLNGTVNPVITSTLWTIANGNSIDNSTSLVTNYVPSEEERKHGALTFSLESTSQGTCKPVSDVKVVLFQQFPLVLVNAGLPQSICYGADLATLHGTLYNVQKASWTTLSPSVNTGTFIEPNVRITGDTTYSTNEYAPSKAEKGNGKDTSYIYLRLTGYSYKGQCVKVVSNEVELQVIPLPQLTMFGGDSSAVCADKDTVSAHAEAKVGGVQVSGYWTTSGTGVFEPNYLTANAHYRLSEKDRTQVSITLAYHAYGGGCDTVSAIKVLYLVPALPTVDAGPDQKICKNNLVVNLDGKVTTAPRFGWSAFPFTGVTATSFNPDSNHLATTFFPTMAMAQNGAVKMRLRSHGPQACNDVLDDLFITFTEMPKVDVKPDSIEICADTDTLGLSASVENASGGMWTTKGSGRFVPSASVINASYLPSESDKILGKVLLTLTSTGNGTCLAVADSVLLRIRPRPVVTDTAFRVCINADSIQIKATSTTGSGHWTASGTGSFSPKETALIAHYYPSFEDKKAGRWNLTFTSNDNKLCKAVSKSVAIRLNELPIADAGKDKLICANSSTILAAETFPNILKYTWTKVAPALGTTVDSFLVKTTVLSSPTTYKLEVTDNNGCTNSDTMVVKVIPKPLIDIFLAQYCAYKDTTIKANVSLVNPVFGSFQWYTDRVLQFGQTQSNTKIDQAGTYLVTFDIGNCVVSDSTKAIPLPSLVGINKFICVNSGTTLEVGSSANKFTWRRNSLRTIPFATTTVPQTPVTSVADTTVYYITAQDANSCLKTDSLIVFTLPKPIFKLRDTTLCAGNPLVLNAQPTNIASQDNRFDYAWQPGGEATATKDVSKGKELTKVDTSTYTVVVKIGNGAGSCDGTAKSRVIYAPLPALDLPDARIFCGEDANSIIDAGIAVAKYEWSTGESSRSIRATESGWYKVKVTSSYKCIAYDSTNMTEKCKPNVHTPTAFTPNGDGNNDHFMIFGNKFARNIRIRIYNRWGEVIYDIEDSDGEHLLNTSDENYMWDGTYRGKPMPVGVYPFLVTYEGKDDEFKGPFQERGSVMIIR